MGNVSVTDAPSTPERQHLDVVIEPAPDGWWAARIEGIEGMGVFGQGRTPQEARRDAASALADLLYAPSRAERLLYRFRRLYANARDLLPAR